MNGSGIFDLNLIQKSTGETFPVNCTVDISPIDASFGVAEVTGCEGNSEIFRDVQDRL